MFVLRIIKAETRKLAHTVRDSCLVQRKKIFPDQQIDNTVQYIFMAYIETKGDFLQNAKYIGGQHVGKGGVVRASSK